MVDLLRRIKSALGVRARADAQPVEVQADHEAALEKLAAQRRRLAALDARIAQPPVRPEHRGFRL